MDPTTSMDSPTGMRTAISSSMAPKPRAAIATPLMRVPRFA